MTVRLNAGKSPGALGVPGLGVASGEPPAMLTLKVPVPPLAVAAGPAPFELLALTLNE